MLSFLKELCDYFFHRKKYWLLPLIIFSLLLGLLLIASQGSVVAPFIYTIF